MASPAAPWRHLVLWITAALLLLLSSIHLKIFPSSIGSKIQKSRMDLPVVDSKHGSEFIYQLPRQSPRGILFIAHGCSCRPTFFWDKNPNCPHCVGLPEDRRYVARALQSRYAVIAIASTGSCWKPSADTDKVLSILQSWIRRHHLHGLPIFALGTSSGGYFISTLALRQRFNATVLMIAEGQFEAMDVRRDYPPTLFVHMPRDERRAIGVARAIELLRSKGVEAGEIRCEEFPMTPLLLSDRISGMDEETSRKIYRGLKDGGVLDGNDLMVADGRSVGWRRVVEAKNVVVGEWEHHIQEVLNAAFAYHETTSVPLDRIFQWFAAHGAVELELAEGI